MHDPDYVVIRPAADLPPGLLSPHLDGLWLDWAALPSWHRMTSTSQEPATAGTVVVPVGRFELRSDGAVAEVLEVRLLADAMVAELVGGPVDGRLVAVRMQGSPPTPPPFHDVGSVARPALSPAEPGEEDWDRPVRLVRYRYQLMAARTSCDLTVKHSYHYVGMVE